ncbi:MAG: hypothetical protein KDB88_10325 [Flavobacteriales bacterium]|nr:hypothetical protein [Flavobacteriales bacterium]
MNVMKITLASLVIMAPLLIAAQGNVSESAAMGAKAEAQELAKAVGLDEKMAARCESMIMEVETSLSGVRGQQEKLQSQVDEAYTSAYKQLSEQLNEEQREKLSVYLKNKQAGGASCAHAKASGCCAGGATKTEKAPMDKAEMKKAQSEKNSATNKAVASPSMK